MCDQTDVAIINISPAPQCMTQQGASQGGNSRCFVQLLCSRPSRLLRIVDVNAYPSHFKPGSLSHVRLQKPTFRLVSCGDELCGKYSVEHPRNITANRIGGGKCLSLCFIPTDRAPQSAAVSAHILLPLLHDRQRVFRSLQVRAPHTRLSVDCNALKPLKGASFD